MVKAVIFDMDGLLLDSERASYEAMQKNCEKLGVKIDKDFYCSLLGLSNTDAKEQVYKHFNGKIDVDKYFDDMFSLVKEEYIKNGVPVKKGYFDRTVDLKDYLKKGENVICVTLYSSNRNLLGPHHLLYAEEPLSVGPYSFENIGTWKDGVSSQERNSYSFVKFGLFE